MKKNFMELEVFFYSIRKWHLQVLGDDDVGHEEEHVLLAAAERHAQQRVQIVDAGTHDVGCETKQSCEKSFKARNR